VPLPVEPREAALIQRLRAEIAQAAPGGWMRAWSLPERRAVVPRLVR
jgi:hypothetical protein